MAQLLQVPEATPPPTTGPSATGPSVATTHAKGVIEDLKRGYQEGPKLTQQNLQEFERNLKTLRTEASLLLPGPATAQSNKQERRAKALEDAIKKGHCDNQGTIGMAFRRSIKGTKDEACYASMNQKEASDSA